MKDEIKMTSKSDKTEAKSDKTEDKKATVAGDKGKTEDKEATVAGDNSKTATPKQEDISTKGTTAKPKLDKRGTTTKPTKKPKKPAEAKSNITPKAPKPNGIFGYRSASEKSLQKTVDFHTSLLISCIVISILSLLMGILNVLMIKGISDNRTAATLDEWVECELENNVGYKVKKDWSTTGYNDSVIFQPSETTAVAVGTKSVADINRGNSEIKLSHDTLRDYIEADLKTIGSEKGYAIHDVTYEEFVVLGTTGYRYTFRQDTPTENQTVTTYTDSVFFIYEGYLYTFSYTSGVMGYAIPEYQYVLDSIRLIPASERPTVLPSDQFNKDIVDNYASLGESLASTGDSSSSTE